MGAKIRAKLAATPQLFSVLTILILLALSFLSMCAYSESYKNMQNISKLIVQCIPLAVVSLGQTLVVISGGIDLSLGATISLTTTIAARLMGTDSPAQIALGVLAMFAAAAVVGLINGVGVNLLRVPPLITTLCMSTVLQGVALWIMPVPGGKVNREFAAFIMQKWGAVSMPLIVLAFAYLIIRFILYRTRTGVHLYAIGKNARIATSMGIRVRRVSMRVYVIAALMAALTGLLLACRMRVGDPLVGTNYTMDSITAAAIGGTSLAGGIGLISGSVLGSFLIGMLSNMMNILGVDQFYQYVLKGCLLVLAMILYSIPGMLGGKRIAQ
jgi:ribose/xylose/arabinose/galactoside ABC-type transport system permease subunit